MSQRNATVWLPSLAEREHEIERLVDAFTADAVAEFAAVGSMFHSLDVEWLRAGGLPSLDEIEFNTRRLVAMRNWGVVGGAQRLGITHSALSRWARRRRLPT